MTTQVTTSATFSDTVMGLLAADASDMLNRLIASRAAIWLARPPDHPRSSKWSSKFLAVKQVIPHPIPGWSSKHGFGVFPP